MKKDAPRGKQTRGSAPGMHQKEMRLFPAAKREDEQLPLYRESQRRVRQQGGCRGTRGCGINKQGEWVAVVDILAGRRRISWETQPRPVTNCPL